LPVFLTPNQRCMSFLSKIFGQKKLNHPLIGEWNSDLSDENTKNSIGNVSMIFSDDGKLVYKIKEGNKLQIINLVYSIDGNLLITDQPSRTQIEKTEYTLPDENTLILQFEGETTRYIKEKN